MAIISAPDGSYYSNKTGKTYTREEVMAKVEEKKAAKEQGGLFDSFFSGGTTSYEQTGAIDNAVNGYGRGVDVSNVQNLHNANTVLETDSDKAARLREASDILGLDDLESSKIMRGGLDDDGVMKSALALAKKKQSEPEDWEQFAADHPATIKYLEQQKNMAISYDDVKPLGRLEETANTVKAHLEMMDVEEKIAELGRKYDSLGMSYNELSADQRVELQELIGRRKEIAESIDTWSVGNVLGGLLAMKEDLPIALGGAAQGAILGGLGGLVAGGVGAVPGALTGAGAGFKLGMGVSMGYRMAGTQYAENMMRADANGQYMDAQALRNGAWGAGAGMMALGTFGVGRLANKLPLGAIGDKFLRTVSPSVLNNPEAREVAWRSYLSTLGVGAKEVAAQDLIFGGGTAALTYGANRYAEASSGLDYSNREDGTLIDNIINGMQQFLPMALGMGLGVPIAGKFAGDALGAKKPANPMPVADGLNKIMNAMDETKTAQRSPQATRDMVNTVFGETASAQDVEINARGFVRLFQEADPDNPNRMAEVAQALGVDEKTLNEAVELDDYVRVSVGDFVKEFGLDKDNRNLRAEILKEVRDVDGHTETERGEVLTQQKQEFENTIKWLEEQKDAQYDHNDPAYIAAMDIASKAYPDQPRNLEQQANIYFALFKRMEENGTLQMIGFDSAEQALRAIEVRRMEAPENQSGGLNQMAGEKAKNAPLAELEKAKGMEAAGEVDPETIYKETGWLKGKDGKWRFEIPDNLDAIDFSSTKETGVARLRQIYDNPKLYQAYPGLENTLVKVRKDTEGSSGSVAVNVFGDREIHISASMPDEDKARTLVHEVQHLIQMREGFASGGSVETVRMQIQDRIDELAEMIPLFKKTKSQQEIKELTEQQQKLIEALGKYDNFRLYRALGGEEEARRTVDRAESRAKYFKEAEEASAKFEQAKSEASPEQLEALQEYEKAFKKIYSLEDASEEEERLFEEVAGKLDEDLREAFQANEWYKEAVNMIESGSGEMPEPHDSFALIVFDGVEHAAESRKSVDFSYSFGDNITKEVFETYLRTPIMDMVRSSVSKQIDEQIAQAKIDLSKMTDETARQEARESLPYIHKLRVHYNQDFIQNNPDYKNHFAAKLEYARRCFDNDERISNGNAGQVVGDSGPGRVRGAGAEALSGRDQGETGSGLRGSNGTVQDGVSVEYHGAREHFQKLYDEIKQKHSDDQGAFHLQQTDERAANDVANTTVQELFQSAWHGTPHDFDKFDLGAIGTGEGAQAHGWGLYFAGNREVSQRYKEVLSAGKSDIQIMFGDRRLPAFGFVDGLTEAETKAYKAIQSVGYDKDKAIALLMDVGEKEAADIVEKAKVHYKENKGKLFEVEIPDNDVLLDEQKTYAKQPLKVKEAINRIKDEFLKTKIKIGDSEYVLVDGAWKINGGNVKENTPVFYALEVLENREGYIKDSLELLDEWKDEVNNNKERINEKGYKNIEDVFKDLEEAKKIIKENKIRVSLAEEAEITDKSTGREIYNSIENFVGSPRYASKILNDYGIKGITYEGGRDGRCFVVFDDKAVDVINKYNQEAAEQGNTLASYMPQEAGHAIIELYKNANPSSLAHEMLHHWVTLNELAYKTGKMDGQVLTDFQKLAEFAGHELGTEWSREEHEKLASAWETYLSEGKAPSLELVGTFSRFKEWMKKIYETLTRHAIPINDEVRGVFDRMLASDRELALAEDFYLHEELFAGREMDGAAKREYVSMLMASEQEAQREMDKRVMAEVNPAMKGIQKDVEKNLREDIGAQMMLEPVYVARSLFTAPKNVADIKAAREQFVRDKMDAQLDMLVRQSAQGIEQRGQVITPEGEMTGEFYGGGSINYDWYRELVNRRGGKIPDTWRKFIAKYKAGEKTLKQMPRTMREEYEHIAEQQLGEGYSDSIHGDIPEDMEFINVKEGNPALPWIIENGGGIRLNRASVYERYGQGSLPERWLTDEKGFTLDEVADYIYDGKAGGDRLYEELTTKPTFAKELNNRVRAKMGEFKDNELGTLRESAIKAVYNEKSMDAVALRLEVFERMAAEKKAREQQKTADAIEKGKEKAKWENKVEAAEEKAANKAAREQRWLDAAISRGTLKAKAAREMAREQINNTAVGEVMKWQRYTALANRARKDSIRSMSKGDYDAAIEATNRELACHAMAKEAAKADTELKKTMRYFGRINKRGNKEKNIPHEFNVQTDNILANYGLLTRKPLQPLDGNKSLQTFILECQEDYFVPQVADFLINGQPQHYTRLTVNEMRDLKSSVESIRHVGRQMDALVAGEKKQNINDVAGEMVKQLSTHEKRYTLEGEMGTFDKTPVSVTSLVKAETLLRLMDKGEENGVFVRNIYNPIKLGLDDVANRSRKVVADVDKILADTGWTKAELAKLKEQEHTFEFMPNPKISHEQVLHAALNWGNEGNRDRLRYYFMTTDQRRQTVFRPEELAEIDGKVMQMFEVLTEKDLKLVQGIWDYLNTYAGEIRKHEIDCSGVDPKMVEASPFSVMTADGKVVNLKGGYYPIRYDSGKSVRAMDLAEANELFKHNSAVGASVAHGHTKERVNHMSRQLLLDWSTFTDHLRNVNYDLAMRKPIMDVSRLLRREDVQSAMAETFGNDNVRMLQTWLRDIATDQTEALTFTEKAMRWTRTRMSVAFLGFRTKALFIDLPQNFITAAWQNGVDEVVKATGQFYLSGDYREKMAFVNQRSPMMRDKASFMDQNLADLRADLMDGSRMASLTRTSQKLAFCCDMFADSAVNYPTWLRYYDQAVSRGLDDAAASLEADAKVRRQSVDTSKAGLAAVQRGGEGRKLMTPFYSYFSAFFNRLYYDYGLAKIKWVDGQRLDAAGLMVRTAVLGVGIPTTLEAIMQGVVLNNDKTKDKKKREENMYKDMASASFSYLANTVPVAGAAASFMFNKAIGKNFASYELSPVEGAVENLFSVPAAVVKYVNSQPTDKDAGRKLAESVAKAAAIGAPYPNMLNTLALNIWDVMTQSGDFTLADFITRRRNQK